MYHHYKEMQNIPMPRGSKRTKPPVAPTLSDKQDRRKRPLAMAEMLQQQNSPRYATPAQVPEFSASYSMTEPRSMGNQSNQAIYPNMSQNPTTSSSRSAPQQRAPSVMSCTSLPEQTPAPRYYTRQRAHLNSHTPAPTLGRHWNHPTPSPPVTQHNLGIQQMNTPAPVARLPPQTKDIGVQTDLQLKPDDIKLLNELRAKRYDLSKIISIIEKDEYVVTFEDTTSEDESDKDENVQHLVNFSDVRKNMFLNMAYALQLQRNNIVEGNMLHHQNLNRAIQYYPQTTESSTSQMTVPPSQQLDESQQQGMNNQASLLTEATTQETMNTNMDSENFFNATPVQPQMPQQRATPSQEQNGYYTHNNLNRNYYNANSRYNPQFYWGNYNSSQYHRFQNIPMNFLHAAAVYFNTRNPFNNYSGGMGQNTNSFGRVRFPNPNYFQPHSQW